MHQLFSSQIGSHSNYVPQPPTYIRSSNSFTEQLSKNKIKNPQYTSTKLYSRNLQHNQSTGDLKYQNLLNKISNKETTNINKQQAIKQIMEKLELVTNRLNNHQVVINQIKSNKLQLSANSLIQKLKQNKSFTSLISNYNDEISQNLFSIKLNIRNIEEELKKFVRVNTFAKQINSFQNTILQKYQNISEMFHKSQIINKKIANQVQSQMKKYTNRYQFLIDKINNDLKEINKQKTHQKIYQNSKSGMLRSLSQPIIIEYKQTFKIHRKNNQALNITLCQILYYIDNDGYLLDNQNHYIINNYGKKIKLQQRHINILKQNKLLQ